MTENLNTMSITGKILKIEESHTRQNKNTKEMERFFTIYVDTPRLSTNKDVLPMVISEKLMFRKNIESGSLVSIVSKLRTRNYEKEGKKHLSIFGLVENIEIIEPTEYDAIEDKNLIVISGYICKNPTLRTTRSGRVITDLLIACNHFTANGKCKSDYVPCITWGTNAKMASSFCVGDEVSISGRFQSRVYHKKNDPENKENIAYEVSSIEVKLISSKEESSKQDDTNNLTVGKKVRIGA